MNDELTNSDVRRTAALAHLDLEPREEELLTRQLADILAYVRDISSIDTRDVPPTSHVLTTHSMNRADEVTPSLDVKEALANAPERVLERGLFKVPRVIG